MKRRIDGTYIGTYTVGGAPVGICFDGTYIWTANEAGTVTKLLASNGSLIASYTSGGNISYGICWDGEFIWAVNEGSQSVTKFKQSNGSVLGTYTVGVTPYYICASKFNFPWYI
jgi:DNA-binding beta-propeller fold protein YncE